MRGRGEPADCERRRAPGTYHALNVGREEIDREALPGPLLRLAAAGLDGRRDF